MDPRAAPDVTLSPASKSDVLTPEAAESDPEGPPSVAPDDAPVDPVDTADEPEAGPETDPEDPDSERPEEPTPPKAAVLPAAPPAPDVPAELLDVPHPIVNNTAAREMQPAAPFWENNDSNIPSRCSYGEIGSHLVACHRRTIHLAARAGT